MIIVKSQYMKILLCIALGIATIAVYFQVINFGFVNYDDPVYVYSNPMVKEGLTFNGIKWAYTSFHASNWHPLTWISHMLDVEIFGVKPGMHHLINVLFHLFNVILLFIVLENMTGALWRSAIVAGLFALHPLHVESVAWISERKDVLSTFFWMLTMLSYLWYVRRRNINRYCITVFFYILGLMAKPMLVTLPFTLILLDFWPLKRVDPFQDNNGSNNIRGNKASDYLWSRFSSILLEKIPLFVFALISSVVTFYAQRSGGAVVSTEHIPIGDRIANAIVSYIIYLWKTVWPLNLSFLYPYSDTIDPLWIILCALLLLSISSIALFMFKKFPYLLVGWLWYLGTLIPVIGIVQVGAQSMADRYMYIPLIGVFLMLVWGLSDLIPQKLHRGIILVPIASAILILLASITWIQISYWKASENLYRHAIQVTKNNQIALNNLGLALFEKGDLDSAVSHLREALRIKPRNVNTLCALGLVLTERGETVEAAAYFNKALEIDPDNAVAHGRLGVILAGMGKEDSAIKHFNDALEIDPDNTDALIGAGIFLVRRQPDEALKYFNKALEIDPDNAIAHNGSGMILYGLGKEEAVKHFNEVIRIKPDDIKAHEYLGDIMLRKGNMDEAIEHYVKVLNIDSRQPEVYNNLGTAYIHKGNIRKAIGYFQKSLQEKPDYAEAAENLRYARINQNKLEDTALRLQDLIKTDPGNPALLTRLGNVYRQLGDYDKAISQYQEAILIQPDFSQALYGLVLVYSNDREYTKALEVLEDMRNIQPENPEIYYNIACIYAKQDMVNESIKWLKQAIEKGFDNWDLLKEDPDLEIIRKTEYVIELMKRRGNV